jgi:magnesium transporter
MNDEHNREFAHEPWKVISECLRRSDVQRVNDTLAKLGSGEVARTVLRLSPEDQRRLLTLLAPQDAAAIVREVGDELDPSVMEYLPAGKAAAILNGLPSDDQADLLGEMDDKAAQAVLDRMAPAEAADARRLLAYDPETAGGLMVTEYLAYPQTQPVQTVLDDLLANRDKYADYDVQYFYVTDNEGRLAGVLRSRDILFAPPSALLKDVMVSQPLVVRAGTPLAALDTFFNEHHLLGAPVTDDAGHLIGVILPEDVEEAVGKRANRQFLRISGIIAGEEFRSTPMRIRAGRRLSWLSINIALNVLAASVIAFYQDTIQAVIALAVFLPIISDMSSCSGGQAVAVSIRELALGLVRPREILRVLLKESSVGLVNGLVLGALLAGVAVLWKGNVYLGLVVGVALAVNTLVSVSLGGILPLLLRRVKIDPALLSGPILTTVTDTCGFFLTLGGATLVLPRLVAS